MLGHLKACRRIAALAVLGLILRSLVAPGLMVVDGADGFGGLALVLCPGQNPGLNFELLSASESDHHHRGAVAENSLQMHSDLAHSTGLHAESLDAGCAAWVASGAALPATKPLASTLALTLRPPSYQAQRARPPHQRNHHPRAPPIVT